MSYVMKYDVGEFKNVYRPRSFDYLVGQPGVKTFFRNSLVNNNVPHVMLFEGSKGTGKTTTARIVAMCLNCENTDKNRPRYEPCLMCNSCRSILDDNNPDFQEMNVADKTGVNDMRALAESFSFTPMYLENKVFILDEAHQLSKAAQNKLLKDLEDTPEDVYIIFCTTDSSSLLPTLIDRCYTFRFSHLTTTELLSILDSIIAIEGVDIASEIKELLVNLAEGSARSLLVNLHKTMVLGKDVSISGLINVLGSSAEVVYSLPDVYKSIMSDDFVKFKQIISKFNPKECNDLCYSLVSMLGSRLNTKSKNAKSVSRLIDNLVPILSIVNKGAFINAVFKYITGK